MQLNVGQKIFSIAVVILALMLVVAAYSLRLIDNIADDLKSVTQRQIPVAEAVARINVRVLEQGVLLQRLFLLAEEGGDLRSFERQRTQVAAFGSEIDDLFESTRKLLAPSADLGRHGRAAIAVLARDLETIEAEYRAFQQHSAILLATRERGDRRAFDALLPELNARQDAVDAAVIALGSHAAELTERAVAHADRDERALFTVNATLTTLAAVLGFGVALLITRALVRAVRNLVAGTEAVEAGDLDVEVEVVSTDEVGRLTGSFNTMVDGLRLKERIKDTFGKYMDPRIVSNLLDHPEFAEPGGERREMSVMFIDLKVFTSISERLAADDLVRMINGFFGHMTEAISSNKGVVDKFMGDAVMAFWGPPFTGRDEHALLACRAALAALDHLERFRAEVARELGGDAEGLEIDLRIGISTGEMVVGTIGSTASRSVTVMGDPVNLGSRLEGANKAYGTRVMVSERTRELAGDAVTLRELDLIRVKGKAEPTRVYQLLAADGATAALPDGARGRFDDGIAAYRAQRWNDAEAAFRSCLVDAPADPPSQVYLDRVAQLRDSPPSSDWDGVWVFETK